MLLTRHVKIRKVQMALFYLNKKGLAMVQLLTSDSMAYHAKNSSDFVGLRTAFGGRRQVICEVSNGQRVLLNICDPAASDAQIDEALKEGITARNVLGGVMSALQARNILVDFAN